MTSKVRPPDPRHAISVMEWQYQRAHRYWDDCGKLIAQIERAFPGLTCQGLMADGFQFIGPSKGITEAKFYWDKASIRQAGRGDASLSEAAGLFWQLVSDGLSVGPIARVGHRTWVLYETETVTDAVRWLETIDLIAVKLNGTESLGKPLAAGSVVRTKLDAGGRSMRLEINAGTLTIGPKNLHGAFADVDLVIEPPDPAIDPVDFVAWNVGFIRDTIEPLFRRRR